MCGTTGSRQLNSMRSGSDDAQVNRSTRWDACWARRRITSADTWRRPAASAISLRDAPPSICPAPSGKRSHTGWRPENPPVPWRAGWAGPPRPSHAKPRATADAIPSAPSPPIRPPTSAPAASRIGVLTKLFDQRQCEPPLRWIPRPARSFSTLRCGNGWADARLRGVARGMEPAAVDGGAARSWMRTGSSFRWASKSGAQDWAPAPGCFPIRTP